MSVENKLKDLSRYALGLAGIAAVILVCAALFIGFTAVVKFLYPLFFALAAVSICIFLIIILPLSLVKPLRPRLAAASMILSMICTAGIWMYSFLVIAGYLNWVALFLFLFFKAVAPIAAIGLFFKGEWVAGISIILGLLITYGMRFYSAWLGRLHERQYRDAGIIDIEAKRIDD